MLCGPESACKGLWTKQNSNKQQSRQQTHPIQSPKAFKNNNIAFSHQHFSFALLWSYHFVGFLSSPFAQSLWLSCSFSQECRSWHYSSPLRVQHRLCGNVGGVTLSWYFGWNTGHNADIYKAAPLCAGACGFSGYMLGWSDVDTLNMRKASPLCAQWSVL